MLVTARYGSIIRIRIEGCHSGCIEVTTESARKEKDRRTGVLRMLGAASTGTGDACMQVTDAIELPSQA